YHAAQRHRDGRADHAAQQFGVGGQARDQLAAAAAFEERLVQADQVRVQALAQVGDDAFAQQRDEEEARGGGDRQGQRDREHQRESGVDVAAAGEAMVDHPPHHQRQAQGGGAGGGQ